MTRLLDLGIEHISNIIMDMAKLSESCVFNAIESYKSGTPIKNQIFEWSEKLRVLQEEVADLAIELIARYQPVATDLRFIRSSMEIAYGFSRYGRYSYDIADLLEIIGSVADCDKSAVLEVEDTVRQMILLSVSLLTSRNKDAVQKLYQMDDTVDALYRKYLRETVSLQPDVEKNIQPRCYVSALLILRYLERIADHACYIGDSVYYITTGRSSPRR
ncbi:MAG TPA: PhoU domain-containing protein [Candidatus Nitrosopolaris sp.]